MSRTRCRSGLSGMVVVGAVAAMLSTACASTPRSRDYMLGITCMVLDETGLPIQGAEVALSLSLPAYHAVEAVREERQVTSTDGGVVFMFITHEPTTPYVLTAGKNGFGEARANGVAAAGSRGTHVTLVLRRSLLPSL